MASRRKHMKSIGTGGGDRWWGGRGIGALPPHQGGMDRRRPARAQAAHRRLDLARRRRHAHAQRRPQRRPPPAVHRQPVQGDRGRIRAELQHPPPGRADAGRHSGTARLAAHGSRPRSLPRDAHGSDLDRGGQATQPACSRSASSSAPCTTRTRGRSTRTASPTPTRSAPATAAPRSTPTHGSPGSLSAPTVRGT